MSGHTRAIPMPEARLQQFIDIKYAPLSQAGWGPRLRLKFGYFSPEDYYEAVVDGLVGADTEWLDVGGGAAIFPSNSKLAGALAGRCRRLVTVDPSPNIDDNPYAHERHQCLLEDFSQPPRFTLATARMVVEHVTHPEKFVAKLGELIAPGGRVVVYTVSRWAPMTVLSGATPLAVHHLIKKRLWSTEEKDTFPVAYLMNTRAQLARLFGSNGFREVAFHRLDDCRTLSRWKWTLAMELAIWKGLRRLGIGYPESCLIGVYERGRETSPLPR
jgi:hypothetical protein